MTKVLVLVGFVLLNYGLIIAFANGTNGSLGIGKGN